MSENERMKNTQLVMLALLMISGRLIAQDSTGIVRDTIKTDTIVSVNEPVTLDLVDESWKKNQPVYKLKLAIDLPVTLVTTATTLFGFSKIYNKERLTVDEVESLDPRNVTRYDRSATRHYSESATKVANMLFYGSQPLPVIFLLDKRTRKDFPKLALLYLEAMGATGVPYVSAVYFGDRYRPYTYNPETPMDFKLRGGSRNSFYAGHPALVATSTFFIATVFADYHPESRCKWLFYTLAGAATAGTAIGRYLGGRHFPSDLIIGVAMGTASGLIIPRIHRNKDLAKRKTAIMPFFGESNGLTLVHKF
jgi:membrane-associated phospholipid phosphatase